MITEQEPLITADTLVARTRAEQAAGERLLNTYLRETGINDPRIEPESLLRAGVSQSIAADMLKEGTPMQVELHATAVRILGSIRYFSATGHHRFGQFFWMEQRGKYHSIRDVIGLAHLIIAELAAQIPDVALRGDRVYALLRQIENSIERTAHYIARRLHCKQPQLDINTSQRLLIAEQNVLLGHPFHPTPKSSEGFSAADLEQYAPELAASFPLHYFAVAPELVYEDFLSTGSEVIPAEARRKARRRLTTAQQHWQLIPCHPWQAKKLVSHPQIETLLADKRIVALGALGQPVYPTSSVRTVLVPDHGYFFKLPLEVRITHFVRTNPLEHLRRSMDISRIISLLQKSWPHPHTTVLREVGYRTLLPNMETHQQETIAARVAVLFRETPPMGDSAPIVVAALLEPDAQSETPPLVQALRQACGVRPPTTGDVAEWLERYLGIVLVPTLQLFFHHGISLEAHVQNTLVTFTNGWPTHGYFRDLEGASISRERFALQQYSSLLAEDSPALYSDAEAWHRLKYYMFVNHLGQLIFTLAYYVAGDECRLWQVVRTVLHQLSRETNHNTMGYLEELMEQPSLPAKANLLSRFHQRGEIPLYVPVPNLIQSYEV